MEVLFQITTLVFPIFLPGLVLILTLKAEILRFLDHPLDFNKTINGERIFGENKTFRGLLLYSFGAIVVSSFFYQFYHRGADDFIHPVFALNPILIGLMYGVFYNLGELTNSFLKRRISIPAGECRYPLQRITDLLDGFIVVATILVIFTPVSIVDAMGAGIFGSFAHLLAELFMRSVRLKH